MGKEYQAKLDDCILTIAYAHKLPWEKIWNHSRNAELRAKRRNPNVLKEGDRVYIPDIELRTYSIPTGAVHLYVLNRATAKLRLRVVFDPGTNSAEEPEPTPPSSDGRRVVGEDLPPDTSAHPDKPRPDLAYKLTVEGVTTEGRTDGDGYIEREIPPTQ